MFFRKKPTSIDTPYQLKRAIKKLRAKHIQFPITTKYENDLRDAALHPQKVWYKNQGEHWQGWLSGYFGGGFYGRKNHKRTAAFVYNHIMCPPMLIWLVESLGFNKNKLQSAINATLKTTKYQKQCSIIRAAFPWAEIEQSFLQKIL